MKGEKNPHKVGDLVTMVHDNGWLEGVILRVTKVNGQYIDVAPCWTATGPSNIRPKKRLHHYSVDSYDVVKACIARQELDALINEVVKRKAGDEAESSPLAPETGERV